MEKPNIAELLRDCPTGMELDSTLFEGLEFDCIVDNEYLPIRCRIKHPNGGYTVYNFTKYGCWLDTTFAKCVIFPKGKTTWEGFQRPFKDGDILTYMFCNKPTIYIYRKNGGYNTSYYVAYSSTNEKFYFYHVPTGALAGNRNDLRFATEEEKEKLFDAIKANGYKWNAKTKTLEKLIVPKFKVGDKVREKGDEAAAFTISYIDDSCYYYGKYVICNICDQDFFELVPNKFDITTLKEYDKVLVRGNDGQKWIIDFFGFMDKDKGFPFCMCGHYTSQCIPFEPNKELLGTTNDCDEYYKTWE